MTLRDRIVNEIKRIDDWNINVRHLVYNRHSSKELQEMDDKSLFELFLKMYGNASQPR